MQCCAHPLCMQYNVYTIIALFAAVLIGLVEDYYEVSEMEGYLEVCAYLYNHTERSVTVSLYPVSGSATGIKTERSN